jgi:hypothetical protein
MSEAGTRCAFPDDTQYQQRADETESRMKSSMPPIVGVSVLSLLLASCGVAEQSATRSNAVVASIAGPEIPADVLHLPLPAYAPVHVDPSMIIWVPSIPPGMSPPTTCFLEDEAPTFDYRSESSVLLMAGCLKEKLDQMTGGNFEIRQWEPGVESVPAGIALGLAGDYRFDAGFTPDVDNHLIDTPHEYVILSHATGVLLLGETYPAVETSLWKMLEKMGYSQLAPGKHWEVVPDYTAAGQISFATRTLTRPAFYIRQLSFAVDGIDYENAYKRDHIAWLHKNGMHYTGLDAKHVWGSIKASSESFAGTFDTLSDWFDATPEAITRSSAAAPGNDKFCVGYSDGVHSVVDAAIAFARHRAATPFGWEWATDSQLDTVSISATDGADWYDAESQCLTSSWIDDESPSDRNLWLANAVAADIKANPGSYGDVDRVAMYAYHFTSPPPTTESVSENVLVVAADGYVMGGLYFDQVVAGWKASGRDGAVPEIAALSYWGRGFENNRRAGLPGAPISDLSYVRNRLMHYHKDLGLRALALDGVGTEWGSIGLGMWSLANSVQSPYSPLAPRAFIDRAFPGAQSAVREYYRLLNLGASSPRHAPSPHLIGRLYATLIAARRTTSNPGAQLRVDDLQAYVRYLDLHWRAKNEREPASDSPCPAANVDAVRAVYVHLHRARNRHIVPRIEDLGALLGCGHYEVVSEFEAATGELWQHRTDGQVETFFGAPGPYTAPDFRAGLWRRALPVFKAVPDAQYGLPSRAAPGGGSLEDVAEQVAYDHSDETQWIINTSGSAPQFELDFCAVKTGPYHTSPEQYKAREVGHIELVLLSTSGTEVCSAKVIADGRTWRARFAGDSITFEGAAAHAGCTAGRTHDVEPPPIAVRCGRLLSEGTYLFQVRRGQRSTGLSHRLRWIQDGTFGAATEMSAAATPHFGVTWTGYFYVPANAELKAVLGYYSNERDVGNIQAYDAASASWIDVPLTWNGVATHFEAPIAFDVDGEHRDFHDAIWRFNGVHGQIALRNIPPYVAMSPADLWVPDR